jgi:hypothetical protein
MRANGIEVYEVALKKRENNESLASNRAAIVTDP